MPILFVYAGHAIVQRQCCPGGTGALGDRLPVTMQAIRPGLIETELCGRFQVIPGKLQHRPGCCHNPQALAVLADNLGNMGFFNRTHAVLGMLSDKDIENALPPCVKSMSGTWPACPVRAVARLPRRWRKFSPGWAAGEVFCHDSLQQAMQAAREAALAVIEFWPSDRFTLLPALFQVLGRTA